MFAKWKYLFDGFVSEKWFFICYTSTFRIRLVNPLSTATLFKFDIVLVEGSRCFRIKFPWIQRRKNRSRREQKDENGTLSWQTGFFTHELFTNQRGWNIFSVGKFDPGFSRSMQSLNWKCFEPFDIRVQHPVQWKLQDGLPCNQIHENTPHWKLKMILRRLKFETVRIKRC